MISLFLGPRFSHIIIKIPKQIENIALKHAVCHIFDGLHILSAAVAYLSVIGLNYFISSKSQYSHTYIQCSLGF